MILTPHQREAFATIFTPPAADVVLLKLRSEYAGGSAMAFDMTPKGRDWLKARIKIEPGRSRRIGKDYIALYQALMEQDGLKVEIRE